MVLWPEAAPLTACGQRVVLDPYCGGDPLLLSEARSSKEPCPREKLPCPARCLAQKTG